MRPVLLPRSLAELLDVLSENPGAAPYAGGTDLLVRMRKGLASPPALVCLERVGELKAIQEGSDRVFIGSAATHQSILASPLIRSHFSVLTQALRTLGSPHIRNAGTIGGNVVTASPAGDTLPPLYVLNAGIEVLGRSGRRTIPIRDFILGPGKVDLRPGEVVTGVWLPLSPTYRLHHFEKVGLRNGLAIAVASLAALVDFSSDGKVLRARFAWGSVGTAVVTSKEADAFLEGKPIDPGSLSGMADLVRERVSPIDDVRATASYRRQVAGNLLFRLLEKPTRSESSPAGLI
jgi:CO/xanthine dehydrogenase FAD-binding subunit